VNCDLPKEELDVTFSDVEIETFGRVQFASAVAALNNIIVFHIFHFTAASLPNVVA